LKKRKNKAIAEALVLGTVQFGLPYGIANASGKPDNGQVRAILDQAYDAGIRVLDTAAAYGESEAVLGACGTGRWDVITKVPSLQGVDDTDVADRAKDSFLRSLDLLKTNHLYAVLAHDQRDMAGERGRRVRDALQPFVADGVIGKLGASIYGPSDLESLEASGIVQAPFNVLDQRMASSVATSLLRTNSTELHVRSAFLQGLLLMERQKRPARFARWAADLERYDSMVAASGLSPAAFCLGFVLQKPEVACAVVGVDSARQLAELVAALEQVQGTVIEAQSLSVDDPGLIDPRMWKDGQ